MRMKRKNGLIVLKKECLKLTFSMHISYATKIEAIILVSLIISTYIEIKIIFLLVLILFI